MGLFERGPVLATLHRMPFVCTVCKHHQFDHNRFKLNTGIAEFFDFAWANRSADCLVCEQCGYVHWFLASDPVVEMWEADQGYPSPA